MGKGAEVPEAGKMRHTTYFVPVTKGTRVGVYHSEMQYHEGQDRGTINEKEQGIRGLLCVNKDDYNDDASDEWVIFPTLHLSCICYCR